nr:MAG TPA: zinc-ribbon domain protein [Caudoviricetes sp.]
MTKYVELKTAIDAVNDVYYDTPDINLSADKLEAALLGIPSADVAPVVHGRWDGDNCTACKLPWNYNMTQDADDWGYFDPMPDYCPNCGQKWIWRRYNERMENS